MKDENKTLVLGVKLGETLLIETAHESMILELRKREGRPGLQYVIKAPSSIKITRGTLLNDLAI